MKKTILLLAFILLVFCNINAQDDRGKYALEFNFTPAALVDANAGSMFQMPNLKGRYFLSSDLAARIGLGLGFSNNKNFTDANGNDFVKTTYVNFSLTPGIEKHFGSDKFFIFLGAELPIVFNSNNYLESTGGNEVEYTNPYGSGHIGIGLDAIVGFDFYIFNTIYVGAEFSPGLMFSKITDTTIGGVTMMKGGTDLSFYLSSSSGVRLGVRF